MSEKAKKPFYKRWWFWLIVVVVVIGAAASGDNDKKVGPKKVDEVSKDVSNEESGKKDEEESNEEKIEDKEFGIGEKVELDGQVVEVTEVEKSDGNEFDKPSEGNEYVIVHVLIENHGDKEISYNPFNFKMKNSNGQIEDQGLITVDNDTSLSSGDLAPGGEVSGTLSFEQPKDDGGLQLIFEPGFWDTDQIIFNLQ